MISPFAAVKVRVKRLRDVALPEQAHPGDAGFDLCAAESCLLEPFARAKVATGLAFEIPPGYEIQVRPRSGMSLKQGVTVLNAPGTIDAGYRGEVCVILYNASDAQVQIHPGDRIAQAVMARFETISWEEASELSDTSRGAGGFGSTGVNEKTLPSADIPVRGGRNAKPSPARQDAAPAGGGGTASNPGADSAVPEEWIRRR